MTCTSLQADQDLYTAVAGYLNDVGIRAKMDVVDYNTYLSITRETGWEGLTQAIIPSDPELGYFVPFFLGNGAPWMLGKSILHFDDLEKGFTDCVSADSTAKAQIYNQIQSLMFDKYCQWTPISALFPIGVKSTKVQDDYTCAIDTLWAWTYADVWIDK